MKYLIGVLFAACMLSVISCQMFTIPAGITHDITADVAEGGAAMLPYYSHHSVKLEALNTEMVQKGLPVTLADTYAAAYGKPFDEVLPEGDTGDLATDMKTATTYFQRILKAQEIDNADHYFLTIIETAQEEGFTLFAAVFRPSKEITVRLKLSPDIQETLTPGHDTFYQPYQQTVEGKRLDTVYDWAALPNSCFNSQAQQAAMFTIVANRVIQKQAHPEYWEAEDKWLAGKHMTVVKTQDEAMCRQLGIEPGKAFSP